MIELFSGIGAQKRGFDNSGVFNVKVLATSDIDKEATVEYAAIHHGLTKDKIEQYTEYPSKEEMAQQLTDMKIGYDFEKNKPYDWFKLANKKKDFEIKKYWLAMTLQNNLGDISQIEELPECDVLTYSSPCQSFSISGKQHGISATCNDCGYQYNPMLLSLEERYSCPNCGSKDIKGTRSGLLLEVERILENQKAKNKLPKYLMLENVKNLVGSKFKPDFDSWLAKLDSLGYNTYWKVLNAKEAGVPQNRERVFAWSIRKDIDKGTFKFPEPFDTGIRLKHILEKNVDEKYYINQEKSDALIKQLIESGKLPEETDTYLIKNNGTECERQIDNAVTLLARDWKGWNNYGSTGICEVEQKESPNELHRLGNYYGEQFGTGYAGNVWDSDGVCPALMTAQGGGRQPHVIDTENEIDQLGNIEDDKGFKDPQRGRVYSQDGISPSVDTCGGGNREPKVLDNEIVCHNIKIPVKVRKYDVDCELLCECLRSHKGKITNKDIAEQLNVPLTKVEHWFRQDSCFAIPDPEIWFDLKNLLHIDTNEFDKSIMTFEEKDGVYDKGNRIYGTDGIAATLTCADADMKIEHKYRIRKLTPKECFKLMNFEFEDWDKCVAVGCSNTAGYKAAGNSIVCRCIELLAEHLYKAQYDASFECTDEKILNFSKPQTE